ncbi:MAG TPA: hypothetical protein VFU51_14065 [Gaiellaceae bacterium]|nr:hypothetical protein [Gaiellaceae bacterium]
MVDGAYHYLVHGLVVVSELDLPIPSLDPQVPDVAYRARLGARLAPVVHRRADDPDEPWAVDLWLSSGHAVEFPGRATFAFDEHSIELREDGTHDRDHVAHLLIDHVVPRVVALRGDLMLHASGAVAPTGRAHLFLGHAGAGKSTVVTRLARAGWHLLDDDGVRVVQGAEGLFHAWGGTPDVRLFPDVAQELLPGVTPGAPTSFGSSKRRYRAVAGSLAVASAPAPLGAIFVLEGEDQSSEPTRLSFGEAVSAITRHGFHLTRRPEDIARRVFEQATAVGSTVPAWRLGRWSGIAALETAPATLERLASSRTEQSAKPGSTVGARSRETR